jgi:acyl-ACP thioesterase
MDELVPIPERGRTFSARRRVRLADLDPQSRVRLDAVARWLQDIAIDDVDETGWGVPEHLWFVRTVRVDVLGPLLEDREVELVTWCSGVAALAAGRRWSVSGDRSGRVEVDSVWIHLGPDALPARILEFGVYGDAAGGRRVSTRTTLPEPAPGNARVPWPLRATDVDLHGHVNNAVHWQAVEHLLAAGPGPDVRRPLRARLDFREPIDLGEHVELVVDAQPRRLHAGFEVGGRTKAVALVEPLSQISRAPDGRGRLSAGL